MEQRRLGDRKAGAIGLGTMSFGSIFGPTDEATSLACLDAAVNAGIGGRILSGADFGCATLQLRPLTTDGRRKGSHLMKAGQPLAQAGKSFSDGPQERSNGPAGV